jgi:uncharacterized membrane protein
MKVLHSVLAGVCLMGLLLLKSVQAQPTPPGGQQTVPAFGFNVCNKAGLGDIFLSLIYAVQGGYRVEGWWKVVADQCSNMGNFLKPAVYLYAMSGQNSWSKQDTMQCTNVNAQFGYVIDGKTPRACAAGEQIKGYIKIDVAPQYATMTFNLGR